MAGQISGWGDRGGRGWTSIVTPDIAIDKEFVNFTGGDGDALADAVGDVLNYTVAVTNTGNVTLTGVTVVDPLTGQNVSGVTLAPGASQVFTTSYVLTQADLDGAGNAGADLDIDNTATADSNETPPVDDSEEVPLVQHPALRSTRWSSTSPAATATRWSTAAGDVITYTVTVTNTGNVTLTGVTVVDPLTGQNVSGVTLAPGATPDLHLQLRADAGRPRRRGQRRRRYRHRQYRDGGFQRDPSGRSTARRCRSTAAPALRSTRSSSTSPAATATRWPTRLATCSTTPWR